MKKGISQSNSFYISFSEYLRFHLIAVSSHAKWANLIDREYMLGRLAWMSLSVPAGEDCFINGKVLRRGVAGPWSANRRFMERSSLHRI